LQLCSAETHAQAHKSNLNDGWNASNHNLNYLPPVIPFQRCILYFEIRELNAQDHAHCRENSAATWQVFPSGADLVAPQRSRSYAMPELMGPQNRRDAKHTEAMIKDFRAILANTQDATHHVTIYNGKREILKHNSRNKMYTSDQQLNAMELCV
jgi:hypothetical protein